jgi:aldose 1-epimerase
MIALAAGGYEVDLKPEIGGCISRFTFGGVHVLREAAPAAKGPRQNCSFPMAAYANRIEHGILKFGGREYRIPKNHGDHPHPLHGHGWKARWRVLSASGTAAVIAFAHEPDSWPWAYEAEQRFILDESGLTVRLAVTSRAAEPMPVSLGFHPYFPSTPATRLTANVAGVWLADATMIPTEHVPAARLCDLAQGVGLDETPFIDNSFTGWDGRAEILQPDFGRKVILTATPECIVFHCFIPPASDAALGHYFAAEPVSAMPNSFNRAEPPAVTGARVLEPGKSFAIAMHIQAAPL